MKCNIRNTEFKHESFIQTGFVKWILKWRNRKYLLNRVLLGYTNFLTVIPYTVAHLYYHKYCHVGTYYVLWRLNLDMSMVEYKTPSNVCTMLWVNSHQRSNFGARHMSDTIYISLFRSQERLILNWMRDFDWMKTQLD